MTIIEAIEALDSAKNNAYTRAEKIGWLDRLDRQVKLFLDGYENAPAFTGYTPDTDPATALLIPAPFDEAYLRYMEAQIDAVNQDSEEAARSMAMYNVAYTTFADYWNRTHMPRQACCEFRL